MTKQHITKSAALNLALLALAAPVASAQIRNETVVATPQAATPAGQIRQQPVVQSPEVAAAVSQIRDETVMQSPQPSQIRDETVLQSAPSAPSPSSSPSANGIDWTDVSIGAGGVLALILLGAGGAYAVVHHRHSRPDQMRNLTVTGADGR